MKKRYSAFLEALSKRLDKGESDYGEQMYSYASERLIAEIREELIDVVGWSAPLWERLEFLEDKIKKAEDYLQFVQNRARGIE
jgi:hypothetical protein